MGVGDLRIRSRPTPQPIDPAATPAMVIRMSGHGVPAVHFGVWELSFSAVSPTNCRGRDFVHATESEVDLGGLLGAVAFTRD